mgnify:CR=1 FL=1
MFYDTHAHYDDEAFDQDCDILLPELHRQGIALINDIGCDIPSSKKAISIAAQYPFVYAVIGAWPGNTGDMTEADLEIYGQLAQHPKGQRKLQKSRVCPPRKWRPSPWKTEDAFSGFPQEKENNHDKTGTRKKD